jgi:putative mycofactocin binding protein MftB
MEISNYAVHHAVRVRDEDFGLLFYNSADTRLTFVKCGRSIGIIAADDGSTRLTVNCRDEVDKLKARKVLHNLAEKGLIIETGSGL